MKLKYPSYWKFVSTLDWTHMKGCLMKCVPVKWSQSIERMIKFGVNKFIEIGIDNLHDRLFSIFENLEIKKIFQQHIKEIDIENISENVLSNKRSSNYYKSLDRERTEEIIYNSAKKYGIEVI